MATKAITGFSFIAANVLSSVIDETAKTVRVILPAGTAVTALVAVFSHNGVSIAVGATPQVSGTTANNFTSPVTYTVTDSLAATQDYVVTVVVSVLDTDNALVTLAQLRSYLSFPTADVVDDARLEYAINAASHMANSLTERMLKARSHTLYLDGKGGTKLQLPDWPINTVTSIYESSDLPRIWDATTLVSSDDYILDSLNGIVILEASQWVELEQAIKVIANLGYGYGSTAVPYDLQRAVLQVAAKLWNNERDGLDGKSNLSSPQGSNVTLVAENALTAFAEKVFNQYRRMF